MKTNLWKTIVLAGLLVGSLDIIAALLNFYIQTEKNPVIVLKYIASAVFGKEAYASETTMPLLGLLFHFIIAFCWTIFFFLIYPQIKFLPKNRILAGILYGVFIWFVMSKFVLPLSKAAVQPFEWKSAIIGASILVVAIGLPLSFIAYRYYHRRGRV